MNWLTLLSGRFVIHSGRRFLRYDDFLGKPVAEPTSDAIQARRAVVHHGSSIVALSRFVEQW